MRTEHTTALMRWLWNTLVVMTLALGLSGGLDVDAWIAFLK